MAGDCIVHLVLYFLEEDAGGGRIWIVVDGSGVDVSNLLVKAALAESNFPDFFEVLLEVVNIQEGPILHSLFVNDTASYGELPEDVCTPLAELGSFQGINAITNRNYRIQIIVFYLVVFPSAAGCRKFRQPESSVSSPLAKIFYRCSAMVNLPPLTHIGLLQYLILNSFLTPLLFIKCQYFAYLVIISYLYSVKAR